MTIKRIVLAVMLAPVSVNMHAATLAPAGVAACSSCHPGSGADSSLLPSLTGRSANDIVAAMEAFRSGKRPATVMDRIAKGFTAEETSVIAAWYAGQK